MDSIFGIGAPELFFILILAGILMGPQRIRQVARWLGKTTAQLQQISRGFARQLSAELDAIDEEGDIKGALQDVQELRRELADLRREIATTATGAVKEGKDAIQESQNAVKEAVRTIQPPTLDLKESVAKPANGETAVPPQKANTNPPAEKKAPPTIDPDFELPNLVDVPEDPE